jgi:hypothetical protein
MLAAVDVAQATTHTGHKDKACVLLYKKYLIYTDRVPYKYPK